MTITRSLIKPATQQVACAPQEEKIIQRALEQARADAAVATAEQQATFNATIEELNRKLADAEAKNQRSLSMAQQTRKGTCLRCFKCGSFGDKEFKIGMTRRLEPADRIKELSNDASVPFEFDVPSVDTRIPQLIDTSKPAIS